MGVHRPGGERYAKPGPTKVHCWVWVTAAKPLPGLLFEWRRHAEIGWQGRVVYREGERLVEQWFPGSQITQAAVDDPGQRGRPF